MYFSHSALLNTEQGGGVDFEYYQPSIGFMITAAASACNVFTQYCVAASADGAVPTPSEHTRVITDSGIAAQIDGTAHSKTAEVQVSGVTAAEVQLNGTSAGQESGGEYYAYVHLSSGGEKSWDLHLLELDQTVSTTVERTGMGFLPEGLFAITSDHVSAVDTIEQANSGIGFSFSDGGNERGLDSGFGPQSGANNDVYHDLKIGVDFINCIRVNNAAGVETASYAVQEFNDGGYTLDVLANNAASETIRIPVLGYGAAAPTAAEVTNDTQIAFGNIQANTSVGTQDITAQLGGVEPKGAILFWSRATTDGTATSHASHGIGFVGEDGWCRTLARRWENGVSFALQAYEGSENDRIIDILDPDDLASEGVATFVSFIANGMRINWTTAPDDGWRVEAIFFAGTDVKCAARAIEFEGSAVGVDANVNNGSCNVDFDPTFAWIAHTGLDTGTKVNDNEWHFGIGYITNEATVERAFASLGSNSAGTQRYRVDEADDYYHFNGIGDDNDVPTLKWGPRGLTLTMNTSGSRTDSLHMTAFLCDLPGVDVDARVVSLTTGAGSQSITGLGFAPTHMISFFGDWVTSNTSVANTGAEGFGLGYFNGLNLQHCAGAAVESGNGTTESVSWWTNDAWVEIYDHDGTVSHTVTVTSVDADGFTVSKDTMPTALLVPTISFGTALSTQGGVVRGWLL